MNYELLLVAQAETAVERIINYLAERSHQGAISWCERWEHVLDEVRCHPLQYSLAPNRTSTAPKFAKCSSTLAAGENTAHYLPSSAEVYTSSTCAARARIWPAAIDFADANNTKRWLALAAALR